MNQFQVVEDFEEALKDYTGAPFVITTTSCTMALLLACAYQLTFAKLPSHLDFQIPKRTYVSVPMSIIHAGGKVKFRDVNWRGSYCLSPYPIYDCARRFTSSMYRKGQHQCLSFHWNKILGIQQGGAILTDNEEARDWYRRARYDGRTAGVAPKDDTFDMLGWHCYMSPETAAQGLVRLALLPNHNEDLPNDPYPDLSKMEIFK